MVVLEANGRHGGHVFTGRDGLSDGLYADYGPALLLYLGRGYLPDGRGVTYDRRTVAPGQSIRLDDGAALMFVKNLNGAR